MTGIYKFTTDQLLGRAKHYYAISRKYRDRGDFTEATRAKADAAAFEELAYSRFTIAELEAKLANPVKLNSSTVMSRRYVIDSIRAAGFPVDTEE